MKYLVIVRHGDYSESGHLSQLGNAQIDSLAKLLVEKFGNESPTLIFSSDYDRCRESAEIIRKALKAGEVEVRGILGEQYKREEDNNYILDLISKHQDRVDVIVLVTHDPQVKHFPPSFFLTMLRTRPVSRLTDRTGIDKGKAFVIDCSEKSVVIFP